jgi:hypothetical protein
MRFTAHLDVRGAGGSTPVDALEHLAMVGAVVIMVYWYIVITLAAGLLDAVVDLRFRLR